MFNNPAVGRRPSLFASACESMKVCVWDAQARSLVRCASLPFQAHACCFSEEPVGNTKHHLAVGGKSGHIKILDEGTLQTLFSLKVLQFDCAPSKTHFRFIGTESVHSWEQSCTSVKDGVASAGGMSFAVLAEGLNFYSQAWPRCFRSRELGFDPANELQLRGC